MTGCGSRSGVARVNRPRAPRTHAGGRRPGSRAGRPPAVRAPADRPEIRRICTAIGAGIGGRRRAAADSRRGRRHGRHGGCGRRRFSTHPPSAARRLRADLRRHAGPKAAPPLRAPAVPGVGAASGGAHPADTCRSGRRRTQHGPCRHRPFTLQGCQRCPRRTSARRRPGPGRGGAAASGDIRRGFPRAVCAVHQQRAGRGAAPVVFTRTGGDAEGPPCCGAPIVGAWEPRTRSGEKRMVIRRACGHLE
ncbi:hypothetical protein FF36_00382 [Frankia torreyi]|uniref:Uncharacterized protein n=1 Tax=Frankia torreyi TaxID=1856 RepID=A0A0D8BMN2_9ACTN|nr:hypothetical protein FF36_00382 [Frankia torreyi]KQM07935.1 hypothetical protein FF86_1001191 [Frankia sp. CpI1-P]